MLIDKIVPNNNLYLKYINDLVGWGVFTNCNINKGENVEFCYGSPEKFSKTQHKNFSFLHHDNSDDSYLVLGFGMIYNHSYDSNVQWEIVDYNKHIIRFFAIKDILANTELCHNYGDKYWLTRPKKEMTIL